MVYKSCVGIPAWPGRVGGNSVWLYDDCNRVAFAFVYFCDEKTEYAVM